jgi:hypothetical protein
VTIIVLDESRTAVPIRSPEGAAEAMGRPTLVAKGGGEVAMEELHLVAKRSPSTPEQSQRMARTG